MYFMQEFNCLIQQLYLIQWPYEIHIVTVSIKMRDMRLKKYQAWFTQLVGYGVRFKAGSLAFPQHFLRS